MTVSMPKFLVAVLIKPTIYRDMISDEDIERIGMEIVMVYERDQAREPESTILSKI